MGTIELNLEQLSCPLCGNTNACENVSKTNGSGNENCWCTDPAIKFPKELMEMVPLELREKACICKNCAVKFGHEGS